jgi:hypothetical protein
MTASYAATSGISYVDFPTPWATRPVKMIDMKAAAAILAAQMHRNHHLMPSADPADARYRSDARPVRRARARRRRRT